MDTRSDIGSDRPHQGPDQPDRASLESQIRAVFDFQFSYLLDEAGHNVTQQAADIAAAVCHGGQAKAERGPSLKGDTQVALEAIQRFRLAEDIIHMAESVAKNGGDPTNILRSYAYFGKSA